MTGPYPVRGLLAREKYLVAMLLVAAGSFIAAARHMSHSVWFDESQTVLVARQSTAGDITTVAAQKRAYPPLFFFIENGALKLRDDEIGLRVPAAVFGALAVVAVFFLGRRLFGDLTGALAALLFALTPGVMRYFVDGNAYTLLVLLATLSALLLHKSVESDKTVDWVWFIVVTLLGLGTHTMYIFYFGAQIVAGVYLRLSADSSTRPSWRRFAATVSAVCVVELFWVWFFFFQGGDGRAIRVGRLLDPRTVLAVAGMFPGPLGAGPFAQLVLWAMLAGLGGLLLYKESRRLFWFLAIYAGLCVTGIALFLKATLPYVAYKHGMGVFPVACMLAAHSARLVSLRRFTSGIPWPGIAAVLICVALAGYGVSGVSYMSGNGRVFEYQDYRGTANYLTQCAGPGDAIVLTGIYDRDPLGYYYHGPATVLEAANTNKAVSQVAAFLDFSSATGRSAWIVVSTFENENPVVARFTEVRSASQEERVQKTLDALRQQGLSAREVASFHRVRILVASQPETPVIR